MKKKILTTIITILIIVIGIIWYKYQLDGRMCLDCPYEETLYPDNIVITNDNGNRLQTASCFKNSNQICYRAILEVKTLSSDLKATGEITIEYDCDYETYNWGYGASKYYTNNNLKGKYTFEVENMSSERVDFDVIRMDGSRINSIKCDFEVDSAKGNLYIYGERVR